MRGNLVSPAAAACAAVLALPFLATPATPAPATRTRPGVPAVPPVPRLHVAHTDAPRHGTRALPGSPTAVPGSTHSLRLRPLGAPTGAPGRGRPRGPQGLPARAVEPFSLVGIVWDDPRTELHGRAQVRTRALGSSTWSEWQDVQTHDDDRPDLDSPEARRGSLRGATAPLWVGASDAVQVRVQPETKPVEQGTQASGRPQAQVRPLPSGLRVELVDPGRDPRRATGRARGARITPAPPTEQENAASAANLPLAPLGATEIPALGRPDSARDIAATKVEPAGVAQDKPISDGHGAPDPEGDDELSPPTGLDDGDGTADVTEPSGRYVGPRPRIVTRAGWGADESLRERGFPYDKKVRAAFVHHTASGNGYSCAQSASVVRGIYRYHVVSSGWRDVGYNFLVDKCGTVYEGRAGGVAKPVRGAHTLGFNTNSMGIAVLGTFGRSSPTAAALDAVATLTAWKLGLYDVNPLGTASLVSAGGNRFKKGTTARLKAISGHRDGFTTECPGDRLYARLPQVRAQAARLQGR
ncbi:N-acetylmuramoyl-L-alanine amidase [Streptomyces sp. NPDC049555]|uniref:N-acetylmuramoyl-L-alanine amidase n=1 Tax=Streptomyces sp. NPDC049555 TaxID=3154930 RepID=UPI00344AEC99